MPNPSDVTNLGVVLQYTSEFKDTGEVLKFLNAVDDLTGNLQFNKYFKDTGTLIDSLTRKTQEYAQALKNGDGSAKTLAQDVVKTANALEGISGKSLRDVLPQFEQLEKHITRAVSEVPEINKAFRPEQFANIKSSVDMLNAARQGLGDEFIKRLSATSNIGALKRQIEELSVALQNAEEKIRELSKSQGAENLERLQSQLRAVRSELESARMMQANEFYSFLSTHQISQHEWEAQSLIDDIMIGAKTYNDAVAELRHMLPERFGGEIQQSSIDALIAKVDTLDAKIAALGNTETAVMTDMARSLAANPVFNADQQAGFAGLSVSGLGDISKLFGVLIENSGAATGGLDGVVGSLTSLLGALQSLGSVDTEKLQAIAGALGAMSHMDKLQISSAAVKNFGEALNKMDAVNDTPKLIALSRLDWTGWQNLKVSKASLNNLSEYLPAISKGVDIGVLERLAALPSEALNANMAALAGRNIKVQFDTAIGGESGAVAESTQRFTEHAAAVRDAVEAEKAKEQQARTLIAALKEEKTQLDATEQKSTGKKEANADKAQQKAAKDAYNQLLGAYRQYYDLQAKLATNPNSSGVGMWQAQLTALQQQLPLLEAEAEKYHDIAEKAGILNKYTAQLSSLENKYLDVLARAVDKLDQADTKTQQTALKTSYAALTEQMQRMYDLQTRIVKNPESPNVSTWQAEADALRAQVDNNEQVLHQYDEMAQELGLLNKYQAKRNQLETAYMDTVRDAWQKRADKAATKAEKDQAQAQITAIKRWQEAIKAANESSASLKLRVDGGDLDKLRRQIIDALGPMRDLSAASVKDGTLQFSSEQIQALETLLPLLHQYADQRERLLRQSDQRGREDSFANSVATMNNKIASTYERYRQAIERSTTARLRFNAIQRAAAQIADGDRAGIAKVVAQLKNLETDLINSGKTVDTWWQKLTGAVGNKMFYAVAAKAAMYLRRALVDIYKNVQEINTAMTQLQIVTGSTASDMATYLDKAAKSAQRLGVNMKDLIDSTTTFARLGYTAEESSLLAEYTAMLTKVGDIDTSAATDAVTAMVKAFGIDMEDVRTVMDEMVVVGNNFPISVAQIAEGMNNASSSLAAAGNTIEQAMALLTAANTTVQNISKSSTGLRTIAARLRKTVVSDDGEEEAMSESDYNDIVKALTKHRVALTDINGEYRSTYDIIQDIAAVWDEMSSMDQAALAEKLAGTRQQNIFYSLVGQFKEAKGAVEATTDAGGEMERAYGVYLDSIEGKLGRVKATFQTLSTDVLNSSTVGTVLDIANGGLKIADALAKINTLLPLTITLVGTIKSVQHVVKAGTFATTLQQLTDMNTVLGRQSGGLTKVSDAWKSLGGFAKAGIVIGGITTAISTVIGLVQQASEARRRAAEEAYQSFTQESQAIDDYKVKIAELKTQLDQGNLSEEQAYEVRKELLGIQQDMIDQLGAEAGAFDILHDSITNVNSALDGYRAGIATKNLNDNAKYYNEALEFANQMLGESEDTLYRIELAGGNLQEIRDIYDNIFGSNLLDNALGLAFIPKDTRQNALRQIQEAYDLVYALDADGLKGQYKDVLLALSAGTEQLRSVSQWQQWWTTLTNYDGVEKAIQEFVTQTIAADVQLTQLYRQLSGSETQFADAVADKDDALAQSIYDEISGLKFDDISNDQVRQYFEDLQSKFAAYADTYILDINLRTRIVSSGALPSLQGAVSPFGGDEIALRSAGQDQRLLSDEQRDAYLQLKEAADANGVTFDHLIDILIDLGVVTKRATAETKDLAEALTITELDTTRGVVKSFHDAWTTMTEDGEVAFEKLKGIFSSLTDKDGNALIEDLDGYISRLAELRDDVPATEAVLNELFAAYVAGQIDAENLAESDLHVVEAMLKEAGVANETEVALDMLVTAKLKAADASGTLFDASGNLSAELLAEIQALLGDGDAASYAAAKLAELELQKIILSNNPLNMGSSIDALRALAGQSTTAEAALIGLFTAVEKVESINSRIESLQAQLAPDITNDYFAEAERIGRVMDEISALRGQQTSFGSLIMAEAKRAMEELSESLPGTGIQWTLPTATGSGSGSTKTFAEQLKERYDAENDALQAQLDLLKHQYDEYRRLGDDDRANQNLRDQADIYDIIMANAHDAADELRNYYLSLGLTLEEANKQADILAYSNIWWDAYEEKLGLVEQQLDDLKQSLDDVTSELDNFQNIYKTLIQVAEQYHTDGFLSVDSLKELLSYGPEYLQFLSDEGGQLTYNEQALQNIIAAKTEEMAVTTATVYLERVLAAIRNNDAQELAKLADITHSVAEANWGYVDSLLAQIQVLQSEGKVSQQYYQNIAQNIQRLQTLTLSATSSMSGYGASLHSSYMSQKDAMEELYQIAQEYVKWELDQQVDALEKQKQAYDDLIDRKKELLDNTKKEADHEKAVAKQVQEIAKLQARINLLSLDDSREAQAERARLEEELSEKQNSLADSQSDYYIEKQKEALDQDKKNFDERKDKEIDALEKTLSSAERLDKATRARITQAWHDDWAGFYDQLKIWNEEFGTHLSNELTKVLDGASDAIALWGDPISALDQVANDEFLSSIRGSMAANALAWWTASSADQAALARDNRELANLYLNATGNALTNTNGTWRTPDGAVFFQLSQEQIEAAIIGAMQKNSADWWTSSEEERKVFAASNEDLAQRLANLLGIAITKRDGVWYRADGTRLYADGGVADYTGTAILHGGKAAEMVLNNADVAKVYHLIHNTPSLIGSMMTNMMRAVGNPALLNGTSFGDTWSGDINITINHSGTMSDADAHRYGTTIADAALDRLRDTFTRRGVKSVQTATLKA